MTITFFWETTNPFNERGNQPLLPIPRHIPYYTTFISDQATEQTFLWATLREHT